MQKRRIGSLEVSIVGLGCNNFGWRVDEAGTDRVVGGAIDAGINFFDTADIYGGTRSEEYLGGVLGSRRDSIVLATKFGLPVDEHRKGAKPDYVRAAIEDSLRRLNTDRIDLYQLHRPDPETPIADTLEALDGLVKAGKVREIGCSNFTVEQLREAKEAAKFVAVQNEYSLLHREPEAEVLGECLRQGLGFIPYFPLASGLLTGKYRKGLPIPQGVRIQPDGRYADRLSDSNMEVIENLIAFAQGRGHTLLELSMSWLAAQPAVASIIAGATSADQARANAKSVDWQLSPADLQEINRYV